jgi:hypothetical protein
VVTLVTALVVTGAAGVPLRDPDHVASTRFASAVALIVGLVGLDILVRAIRRPGSRWPTPSALRAVRRERWTPHRGAVVAAAVVSFYVSYLAYRNLKSVVPLLRPGELFDGHLLNVDYDLFGGTDPGALLHQLLGTGAAAHVLSGVYMLFFAFIPVSLALALVFSVNLQAGLFFATALSLNWALGAGSYFLLPSIGPFHADPATFAALPATEVGHLQQVLIDQRAAFLADPSVPGSAQSIGAFASLHVSIYATAALAAHLLGFRRAWKAALWILTAATAVSTIYFGWHYVLDDLGGVVIAAISLALARVVTGVDLRTARRARHPQGAAARRTTGTATA